VWFQKTSIPPPQRVIGIPRTRGPGLKGQNFKGKYEPKLEFPEGLGGSNEKPSVGGCMDIFWNNTFYEPALNM